MGALKTSWLKVPVSFLNPHSKVHTTAGPEKGRTGAFLYGARQVPLRPVQSGGTLWKNSSPMAGLESASVSEASTDICCHLKGVGNPADS